MNREKNRHLVLIFIGLMASLLIYAMDSTIFSTAMKKIVEDIGGQSYYAWPFTSYLLFSTAAIPISGAISDLRGHKPVFLGGIVLFLAGSALCGISHNMMELILFRALQGIGGGVIVAGVFTIVADLFPPAERGKYTGIVSSMYGLANLIGPVAGGFISDRFGWRWIFYLNLPIGIFAFCSLLFSLPAFRPEKRKKADVPGMVVLTMLLFPFLIALSFSGTVFPWRSPLVLGMIAFSALMLIPFAQLQKKAESPILPPSYFKNRSIGMSLALSLVNQILLMGAVIYLPLFEQEILKMSATASGMVLAPMMVCLVLSGNLTGLLVTWTEKYRIWSLIGFVIAGFGMWWLSVMNAATSHATVIIIAVVMGIGLGMNMPVGQVNAQNSVPKQQIASVTSAVTLFRNIGTATGSAFFGAVLAFAAAAESGTGAAALSRVFQTGIWVSIPGIIFAALLRDAKINGDVAVK